MNSYDFVKDFFDREESFYIKRMFGTDALVFQDHIVLVLSDKPKKTYQGKTYPLPPWDGILVPTEKIHHQKLIERFPFLIPHPILKKWLFLPGNSPHLEEKINILVESILNGEPLVGIPVKLK